MRSLLILIALLFTCYFLPGDGTEENALHNVTKAFNDGFLEDQGAPCPIETQTEDRCFELLLKPIEDEEEEFDCGHYPYIQLRTALTTIHDLTPKNIMEQFFLSAPGSLFRDEVVHEFINKRGWKQNTFYNVFATSDNIVPLISQSEYVHVNKLDWNQGKFNELERMMDRVWEQLIVSQGRLFGSLYQDIIETDFMYQLPDIGEYIWTEDLIIAFMAESNTFRLLGTKKRLFVKIPNHNSIETEFDLIAYLIRTEHNGAAKLKIIEKRLSQIDLISNYFPKSYEPTELYQIINDEIVLSDLLEGS